MSKNSLKNCSAKWNGKIGFIHVFLSLKVFWFQHAFSNWMAIWLICTCTNGRMLHWLPLSCHVVASSSNFSGCSFSMPMFCDTVFFSCCASLQKKFKFHYCNSTYCLIISNSCSFTVCVPFLKNCKFWAIITFRKYALLRWVNPLTCLAFPSTS